MIISNDGYNTIRTTNQEETKMTIIKDCLPYTFTRFLSTETFQSDITQDLENLSDEELLDMAKDKGLSIDELKRDLQFKCDSTTEDTWKGYTFDEFFTKISNRLIENALESLKELGFASIESITLDNYGVCEYNPYLNVTFDINLEKFQSELFEYLESTDSLTKFYAYIKAENTSRDGFMSWTENNGVEYINKLTDKDNFLSRDNQVTLHQIIEFIMTNEEISIDLDDIGVY